MNLAERKVKVGDLYPAAVLGEEILQSAFGLLAKRALEIGELDDGDRSVRISSHPGGVVGDIYVGGLQHDLNVDTRPQRIGVGAAGFQQLELLQGAAHLVFHVLKPGALAVLAEEIGLYLAVGGVRNLGFDFLLDQFFGGNSALLGFSYSWVRSCITFCGPRASNNSCSETG
jgi:hypothetical protein